MEFFTYTIRTFLQSNWHIYKIMNAYVNARQSLSVWSETYYKKHYSIDHNETNRALFTSTLLGLAIGRKGSFYDINRPQFHKGRYITGIPSSLKIISQNRKLWDHNVSFVHFQNQTTQCLPDATIFCHLRLWSRRKRGGSQKSSDSMHMCIQYFIPVSQIVNL